MNTITAAIPCPSWCIVDHDGIPPGAGFHAGPPLVESAHHPGRL